MPKDFAVSPARGKLHGWWSPSTRCAAQRSGEKPRPGSWLGSADDRRDGFIHFSLAHQLQGTIGKYFAGRSDLRLIGFDPAALGPSLRYEASRNGELFPHLYAALDTRLALEVRPVVWVDGQATW